MRIIDTHSHVSEADFDHDRDGVWKRAEEGGVVGSLNVATEPNSWVRYLDLAEGRRTHVVGLGFHPNYADTFNEVELERLRSLFESHPGKAVAVGETGLDFFRDHCSQETQRRAFRAQLDLAAELDLPLILHCRRAEKEMCQMLRAQRDRVGKPLRGVWHCFTATPSEMQEAVELGLHLGLGGVLTYPKAKDVREAARRAPAERLVLETDAPYLPPQPWRGQRNEPSYLIETARTLAEVRGLSLEQGAQLTSENARRLFRSWEDPALT